MIFSRQLSTQYLWQINRNTCFWLYCIVYSFFRPRSNSFEFGKTQLLINGFDKLFAITRKLVKHWNKLVDENVRSSEALGYKFNPWLLAISFISDPPRCQFLLAIKVTRMSADSGITPITHQLRFLKLYDCAESYKLT